VTKILIIDDDEQLGRSIARLLERAGYECAIVLDPREATSRTDVLVTDLVVIEFQNEWLTQIGELRERLENEAGRPVPFVFTVGRRELYRVIAEIATGIDDWVGKPFDAAEFVLRIETALRRSRDRRVRASAA